MSSRPSAYLFFGMVLPANMEIPILDRHSALELIFGGNDQEFDTYIVIKESVQCDNWYGAKLDITKFCNNPDWVILIKQFCEKYAVEYSEMCWQLVAYYG